MRKDAKDTDDIRRSVLDIYPKTSKLLSTHAKVLNSIEVMLMLPLAIVLVIAEYSMYRDLPEPDRIVINKYIPFLSGHLQIFLFDCFFGHSGWTFLDRGLRFLVIAVTTIIFIAVLGLSLAATLHSVGLHFAGQAVSFLDVLRASIPRLWMRLTITNTYYCLVLYASGFLFYLGVVKLVQFSVLFLVLGMIALSLLSTVSVFFLNVIFTVAVGVSVFEEKCGWAAVKRSLRLLRGRKEAAPMITMIWVLPDLTLYWFQSAFRSQIVEGELTGLNLTLLLLSSVAYIAWTTFMWQLQALCWGVVYASFGEENVADSLPEKQTMIVKGGSESTGLEMG